MRSRSSAPSVHRRAPVVSPLDAPGRRAARAGPDPARREPRAAAALCRRESFQLIYIDPPFNTGRAQERRTLRAVGDRGRRAHRLSGAPLPHASCSPGRPTATASTTTSAFLAPRLRACAPAARARRARCTSTSTTARRTTASCCSTRSSAASCFPQRDHLGLRLRRARRGGAGRPSTTRSSST